MHAVLLLTPRDADPTGLRDAVAGAVTGIPNARAFDRFPGSPDLGGTWTTAVEIDGAAADEVTHSARTLIEALTDQVDPERSLAVAGTRAVLFGDQGAVQIFFTLFRRQGTTHDEFERHWREVHATFVQPGGDRRSYAQLYADRDASTALSGALGLPAHEVDGIAMPSFDDPDRLQAALTTNFDPKEAEDLGVFTEGSLGRGAAMRRI